MVMPATCYNGEDVSVAAPPFFPLTRPRETAWPGHATARAVYYRYLLKHRAAAEDAPVSQYIVATMCPKGKRASPEPLSTPFPLLSPQRGEEGDRGEEEGFETHPASIYPRRRNSSSRWRQWGRTLTHSSR